MAKLSIETTIDQNAYTGVVALGKGITETISAKIYLRDLSLVKVDKLIHYKVVKQRILSLLLRL